MGLQKVLSRQTGSHCHTEMNLNQHEARTKHKGDGHVEVEHKAVAQEGVVDPRHKGAADQDNYAAVVQPPDGLHMGTDV